MLPSLWGIFQRFHNHALVLVMSKLRIIRATVLLSFSGRLRMKKVVFNGKHEIPRAINKQEITRVFPHMITKAIETIPQL